MSTTEHILGVPLYKSQNHIYSGNPSEHLLKSLYVRYSRTDYPILIKFDVGELYENLSGHFGHFNFHLAWTVLIISVAYMLTVKSVLFLYSFRM
jgi:hypothetical protein